MAHPCFCLSSPRCAGPRTIARLASWPAALLAPCICRSVWSYTAGAVPGSQFPPSAVLPGCSGEVRLCPLAPRFKALASKYLGPLVHVARHHFSPGCSSVHHGRGGADLELLAVWPVHCASRPSVWCFRRFSGYMLIEGTGLDPRDRR